MLCIVSCKDISEVSCGNDNIDLVSCLDLLVLYQLCIGGDVVDYLRCKSAPVDGVCGGEHHAAVCKLLLDLFIGEDSLYAVLAVIEIAVESAYGNVVSVLSSHLTLLHSGYTVLRIEYHDGGTLNIGKALESSLSCIARSSNKDNYLLVHLYLLERCGEKIRKDLESHILECAGGAVPQLKNICTVKKMGYLSDICGSKVLVVVSAFGAVLKLSIGKVGKELAENNSCSLSIAHIAKLYDLVH